MKFRNSTQKITPQNEYTNDSNDVYAYNDHNWHSYEFPTDFVHSKAHTQLHDSIQQSLLASFMHKIHTR